MDDDRTQWGQTLKISKELQIENFNIQTDFLNERMQRESVELSHFDLETKLIEKGVV